ncbi:hypothetical protein NCS57_00190400 [Fusarium keratoplasticum]|uniref:Uncharacterized protein n=1 Tax=Fusarium keratoplasticum TaxID=1328300 RepID=A0ACC0RGL2_9HYPO|nr:hypothetical protein NCS57_00190400 [Fusarium keratoplasticum]KAI8685217.1 hypothetical protein NCS57_00190400 [Fusarium keratoplasticum]
MDKHRRLTSLVGAAGACKRLLNTPLLSFKLTPVHTARPPLPARLDGCKSKIEELMRIAGTAGLSFGVYRQGEPAYFANFGHHNVEEKSPVDEETIFPGCSLTKMFVAMALGRAVDEGKLAWDTRVKDLLPDFDIDNRVLRESMTVTDILAHRTGMSIADFYLGSENNIVISHDDSLKFINDQVPIKPFRQEFRYNNLGYELAGLILDQVSGSWVDAVHNAFFDPFGMKRTYIGRPPSHVENVSRAYNTLENATSVEIPTVKSGRGTFGGSSGGIFTCVADLLKAYAAVMDAVTDQFSTAVASTPSSQIKLAQDLFSAKIPMAQLTYQEASYGFGLARVQLPGPMGHIGMNPGLIDGQMPTVAKGVGSTLAFYHQGSLPGALSAIAMVPEHRTAVVVMTNSLSLNDCPDWVLQLLLEEILDAPNRNDYVKLSKESAEKSLQWFKDTSAALDKERINNTSPKPLEAYVGTYWNKKHYLRIDVTLDDGELSWALQGLESEKFKLDHYENDTFLWLRSRDYMASRGRWVDQPPVFWKLTFRESKDGSISSLNWVHDPDVLDGEEYYKEGKYVAKV